MSILRTSMMISGIIMFLIGLSLYSYGSGQANCQTDKGTNWSNISGIIFITVGIVFEIIYVIMPFLPGMTDTSIDTSDLTIPTLDDLH